MKRIVSLVLALSMVLGLCATSFAAVNLEDIAGSKYEAAVEALIELDVVSGYPDGTYRPEKEVNRAELAKLIVICMGLEEDAERAQGDNIFTDVALKDGEAFAWARGYVNTAAAAGVIKGYPTGDFKPEKTVTYAEALTMMLRALGYGNVMEEEGTWPTNAILKARELELTDDVEYKNSSDGAIRGDIAILLWNMLRTPMWKITSENQGTGMTSEASKIMLNVKFPDYSYAEVYFGTFNIDSGDEDGIVEVELRDVDGKDEGDELDSLGWYTYAGNDFYEFVENTRVEVLVNVDEEEILTMVPTGDDKLVEGSNYVLSEDYSGIEGEYAYLRVKGRKTILNQSEYNVESVYVEEVKTGDDYVIVNKTNRYYDDDNEDRVVIVDGERGRISDVEVGDVLTIVTVVEEDNATEEDSLVFYIIESGEAEGKLTKYVAADDVITVEGEEYVLDGKATCIVDPEDEDSKSMEFAGAKAAKLYKDFKNEEVRLVTDAFGFVVRIEFGNLDEEEDTTFGFYKVVKYDRSDDSLTLENEEGENTYSLNIDEDNAKAIELLYQLDTLRTVIKNCVFFVELNKDDEIVDFAMVAIKEDTDDDEKFDKYLVDIEETDTFGTYDSEDAEDLPKYEVAELNAAKYDEKLGSISGTEGKGYVTDEIVVIKLLADKAKGSKTTTFTCEFIAGSDELASLNGGSDDIVYVVFDLEEQANANNLKAIRYVMILDDKVASDMEFGVVLEGSGVNDLDKDAYEAELKVNGEELTYLSKEQLKSSEVKFVAFQTEENDDGELEITVLSKLTAAELDFAQENHAYVKNVEADSKHGDLVTITNPDGTFRLSKAGIEALIEEMEATADVDDYTMVVVNVSESADEDAAETQYDVTDYEVVALDELELEEADRIKVDSNEDAMVVYVIRGMEEIEEDVVEEEGNEEDAGEEEGND